jgi:hypothetical protein
MSHTHASPPARLATELSRRSRTGSANALNFAAISTDAATVSGSAANGAMQQSGPLDFDMCRY